MSIIADSGEEINGGPVFTSPIEVLDAAKHHFDRNSFPEVPPENQIITYCTHGYVSTLNPEDLPSPEEAERQLMNICNAIIKDVNSRKGSDGKPEVPSGERLSKLRKLNPWQIAQLMVAQEHVVRLIFIGGEQLAPLASYAKHGPDRGTYVIDEQELRRTARTYNTALDLKAFAEIRAVLEEVAPQVRPCTNRDLIGVNNGIFNYRTKELHEFDPSVVLLSKIRVDYVEAPVNPVVRRDDGTEWDVETWVDDLFEGEDAAERSALIWRILGAVCRPLVSWNKAPLFFNETGNNGKGTAMSLAKNLVGAESWGTVSIADFEDKFRLAKIVNKNAFGSDENDVGGFTDKMANFKAVVTGDSVVIERKNRDPYDYTPGGLVLQCLNSVPKSKDSSASYYRRLLFVRFDKNFGDCEDRAIKDDYLKRREVLEYVLWKVMTEVPDYYELPVPPSSAEILEDFKQSNDAVREFWAEIEPELAWDLQPWEWLHDLFMKWSERTNPRGGGLKRREFTQRLRQVIEADGQWEDGQWGRANLMDDPELLIAEYDVERWKSPTYTGPCASKISVPDLKPKYRGLRRL